MVNATIANQKWQMTLENTPSPKAIPRLQIASTKKLMAIPK
jgi:hypothetical protein